MRQIDLKTKTIKELAGPSNQIHWVPQKNVPPVWLPDGKTILFEANYTDNDAGCYIYSINLENGNTKKLCEGHHYNINPEGTKLFFVKGEGIFAMELATGKTRYLGCFEKGEGIHLPHGPKLSPSGKYIAYVETVKIGPSYYEEHLYVMTSNGKNKRKVYDKRIFHFGWMESEE